MTKSQKALKVYIENNNLEDRNAKRIAETTGVDKRDLSYISTLLNKSSLEEREIIKKAITENEKFKFDSGEVTGSLELATKLVNLGHRIIGHGDSSMVVYLLGCDGKTKIGVARSISNRIAALQTGNPYEIRLLKEYKVCNEEEARRLEKQLHAMFKHKVLMEEWFILTSEDFIIIDRYLQDESE